MQWQSRDTSAAHGCSRQGQTTVGMPAGTRRVGVLGSRRRRAESEGRRANRRPIGRQRRRKRDHRERRPAKVTRASRKIPGGARRRVLTARQHRVVDSRKPRRREAKCSSRITRARGKTSIPVCETGPHASRGGSRVARLSQRQAVRDSATERASRRFEAPARSACGERPQTPRNLRQTERGHRAQVRCHSIGMVAGIR